MREEQRFACFAPVRSRDRSTICGNPRPIIAVTMSSSEAAATSDGESVLVDDVYPPPLSPRAGGVKAPRAVDSRTCVLAMSVAHQQTGTGEGANTIIQADRRTHRSHFHERHRLPGGHPCESDTCESGMMVPAAALLACVALVPGPARPGRLNGRSSAGRVLPAWPTTRSLPERWSTSDNVAWSIEIPGHGWSSPIVWHDRVFVTSAVSPGAFKAPSKGIFGNDYAADLRSRACRTRRSCSGWWLVTSSSPVKPATCATWSTRSMRGRPHRLAAGSAPRPPLRRAPSQEHLCIGDARDRRRAGLRFLRRQRGRVLLLDGR